MQAPQVRINRLARALGSSAVPTSSQHGWFVFMFVWLCWAATVPAPVLAQGAQPASFSSEDVDLTELSLQDLLELEVTIAARSSEKLSSSPAAVYVLTGDEIRRSGHSSVQEALRMVPGFYVSHWTTNAWDVTSRGFGSGLGQTNLAFLNQLLVMIDGVSIYSPLFAGVWWPIHDLPLRDIDRIEIIRGPGGVLWGSNAVHGIVNIITKSSAETHGVHIGVRGGNDDRNGSMRSGGPLGENGNYRVWVKRSDYDTLHNPFYDFDEDYDLDTVGFRADWNLDETRKFTVSARAWDGDFEQAGFPPPTFEAVPDRGRKQGYTLYAGLHDTERGSSLQGWFSSDRQDIPTISDDDIDTFDIEYKKETQLSERLRLTSGLGYRRIESHLRGDDPFFLDFDPRRFEQDIFRGFVLGSFSVTPKLDLVLGAQLEHNSFTQFEIQPTARVAWTPRDELSVWAAVSRAVRTPSLEERTLADTGFVVGSSNFESEELVAYEIGARSLMGEQVAVDLALFFNDYDDQHFAQFDPNLGQDFLINGGEGEGYGAELAVDLKPNSRWSLRGAYSLLETDIEIKADGSDLPHGQSPSQQFNLRSYYDLSNDWELDAGVYVVQDIKGQEEAEYVRVDLRLGWQPTEAFSLYFGIQGLTEDVRSELDEFDNVRRSAFFGVDWTP